MVLTNQGYGWIKEGTNDKGEIIDFIEFKINIPSLPADTTPLWKQQYNQFIEGEKVVFINDKKLQNENVLIEKLTETDDGVKQFKITVINHPLCNLGEKETSRITLSIFPANNLFSKMSFTTELFVLRWQEINNQTFTLVQNYGYNNWPTTTPMKDNFKDVIHSSDQQLGFLYFEDSYYSEYFSSLDVVIKKINNEPNQKIPAIILDSAIEKCDLSPIEYNAIIQWDYVLEMQDDNDITFSILLESYENYYCPQFSPTKEIKDGSRYAYYWGELDEENKDTPLKDSILRFLAEKSIQFDPNYLELDLLLTQQYYDSDSNSPQEVSTAGDISLEEFYNKVFGQTQAVCDYVDIDISFYPKSEKSEAEKYYLNTLSLRVYRNKNIPTNIDEPISFYYKESQSTEETQSIEKETTKPSYTIPIKELIALDKSIYVDYSKNADNVEELKNFYIGILSIDSDGKVVEITEETVDFKVERPGNENTTTLTYTLFLRNNFLKTSEIEESDLDSSMEIEESDLDSSIKNSTINIYWQVQFVSPKILICNRTIKNKDYALTFSDDLETGIKIFQSPNGKGIKFKSDNIQILTDKYKIEITNPESYGMKELFRSDLPGETFECYCLPQPAFYVSSPLQKTFTPYEKDSSNTYFYKLSGVIYFSGVPTELSKEDLTNSIKNQFVIWYSDGSEKGIDLPIKTVKKRDYCCYVVTAEIPVRQKNNEISQILSFSLRDTASLLEDAANVEIIFSEGEALTQPIVDPQSPAVFIKPTNKETMATISIPFEYSQKVASGRVNMKLFYMNNEPFKLDYSSDESTAFILDDKLKYSANFMIEKSLLTPGQYYKASIQIEAANGALSPWSNITIFKATAYPSIIRASWVRDTQIAPFMLNDIIYYSYAKDKTEPLEKVEYEYYLEPLQDSGIKYTSPKTTIHIENKEQSNYQHIISLKSLLDFDDFREWCKDEANLKQMIYVSLKATFFTKNGSFRWEEPGGKDTNFPTGGETSPYEKFYIYHSVIDTETQQQKTHYSVIDSSDAPFALLNKNDNNQEEASRLSPIWRVYNQNTLISEQANERSPIIDYTALYDNKYQSFGLYGTAENNYQLWLSEFDGKCEFEGQYLIDVKNQIQLNISYNNAINSFKHNRLETKTDTIGSKYPVFFRNPYTGYREFPLSGTISYQSLVSFGDENAPVKLNELGFDTTQQNFPQPHLNLTTDNLYNERIFREKVMEFLLENRPLLYKSQTEGNIVVKLMNISLTPNKTLGRMIYDFSCTCYEVQDLQSYLDDCKED